MLRRLLGARSLLVIVVAILMALLSERFCSMDRG